MSLICFHGKRSSYAWQPSAAEGYELVCVCVCVPYKQSWED